jgi:hypothetical protein
LQRHLIKENMNPTQNATLQQNPIGNILATFSQQSKIVLQYPVGWEDGLTSEEFLLKTKKMLKKKFDAGNQIS